MRRQAVRTSASVLAAILAAAAPMRAATITFDDVARAVGANGQSRSASEVRLRVVTQTGASAAQNPSAQNPSAQGGGSASGGQQADTQQQTPQGTASTPEQTLSQSGGQVQTVDLGDVTGTVCDCGEIAVPQVAKRGGFPWWPFLTPPLICLTGICSGEKKPPTECVVGCGETPPPPGVPEPATLLLFGSGLLALGAGARRRYGRKQLEDALNATTEEV